MSRRTGIPFKVPHGSLLDVPTVYEWFDEDEH